MKHLISSALLVVALGLSACNVSVPPSSLDRRDRPAPKVARATRETPAPPEPPGIKATPANRCYGSDRRSGQSPAIPATPVQRGQRHHQLSPATTQRAFAAISEPAA